MKKFVLFLSALTLINVASAQRGSTNVASTATNVLGKGLSEDKIVEGLKEALNIGTGNATASASKLDGFLKNPIIKIPFPPEAKDVERTVKSLGLNKQVDDFVKSLNRAAEDASKKAAPVFLDAVKKMTISDGLSILNGGDDAASKYLKQSTSTELTKQFSPIVKSSLARTHVTKYWNNVASTYNKMPFVKHVNPNLEQYVTLKAIDGLFKLLAEEEKKIRKDPAQQVTNILQQVFGGH